MKRRFLGHTHMSAIGLCPMCGEAYPKEDGPVCRGCQGEAPYVTASRVLKTPPTRVVPVEEAVGKTAAHDMTRIEPGAFKGPEFKAGQRISVGDICRLQRWGVSMSLWSRMRPTPGISCMRTTSRKPSPAVWPVPA